MYRTSGPQISATSRLYLACISQVNARFVAETFTLGGVCRQCKRKTVHGSFVMAMYVLAKTASGLSVRVECGA